MKAPAYELAGIIREHGHLFGQAHKPLKQHSRVLRAIALCRTAALGGHVDGCERCGHQRISYNSCRNRHCPKCQGTNRERWISARENDLLPVTYFHLVFTLPEALNTLCLHYPRQLYNILFEASKETVAQFGNDPKHLGAQTGMVAVLHTWGQNLSLHPHVHCIVPGGGITRQGTWQAARSQGRYLFPVKAMGAVYRGKFMEKLRALVTATGKPLEADLVSALYKHPWVVYAKQPFMGPKQVIEYLGRYTHRIAISNHRIKQVQDGQVTFAYKDYRHAGRQGTMVLEATEFLRRFCLHILPPGFMKIRHYGILASRTRPKLKMQQVMMGSAKRPAEKPTWQQVCLDRMGFDPQACPCCKTGRMKTIAVFAANAPPGGGPEGHLHTNG